ncbi:uncharacterized protein LOC143465429 isoform X4 [Clavelina lepadiformis]|uniref:uncharacterized protein LOC143465429 isoform X4 n=1 Tax=Clavelina lepadiformis TaxID=159417 RepID=UPI0040437BDA
MARFDPTALIVNPPPMPTFNMCPGRAEIIKEGKLSWSKIPVDSDLTYSHVDDDSDTLGFVDKKPVLYGRGPKIYQPEYDSSRRAYDNVCSKNAFLKKRQESNLSKIGCLIPIQPLKSNSLYGSGQKKGKEETSLLDAARNAQATSIIKLAKEELAAAEAFRETEKYQPQRAAIAHGTYHASSQAHALQPYPPSRPKSATSEIPSPIQKQAHDTSNKKKKKKKKKPKLKPLPPLKPPPQYFLQHALDSNINPHPEVLKSCEPFHLSHSIDFSEAGNDLNNFWSDPTKYSGNVSGLRPQHPPYMSCSSPGKVLSEYQLKHMLRLPPLKMPDLTKADKPPTTLSMVPSYQQQALPMSSFSPEKNNFFDIDKGLTSHHNDDQQQDEKHKITEEELQKESAISANGESEPVEKDSIKLCAIPNQKDVTSNIVDAKIEDKEDQSIVDEALKKSTILAVIKFEPMSVGKDDIKLCPPSKHKDLTSNIVDAETADKKDQNTAEETPKERTILAFSESEPMSVEKDNIKLCPPSKHKDLTSNTVNAETADKKDQSTAEEPQKRGTVPVISESEPISAEKDIMKLCPLSKHKDLTSNIVDAKTEDKKDQNTAEEMEEEITILAFSESEPKSVENDSMKLCPPSKHEQETHELIENESTDKEESLTDYTKKSVSDLKIDENISGILDFTTASGESSKIQNEKDKPKESKSLKVDSWDLTTSDGNSDCIDVEAEDTFKDHIKSDKETPELIENESNSKEESLTDHAQKSVGGLKTDKNISDVLDCTTASGESSRNENEDKYKGSGSSKVSSWDLTTSDKNPVDTDDDAEDPFKDDAKFEKESAASFVSIPTEKTRKETTYQGHTFVAYVKKPGTGVHRPEPDCMDKEQEILESEKIGKQKKEEGKEKVEKVAEKQEVIEKQDEEQNEKGRAEDVTEEQKVKETEKACDSSEDSKTEEAACCATNLSEDKETSEINDMTEAEIKPELAHVTTATPKLKLADEKPGCSYASPAMKHLAAQGWVDSDDLNLEEKSLVKRKPKKKLWWKKIKEELQSVFMLPYKSKEMDSATLAEQIRIMELKHERKMAKMRRKEELEETKWKVKQAKKCREIVKEEVKELEKEKKKDNKLKKIEARLKREVAEQQMYKFYDESYHRAKTLRKDSRRAQIKRKKEEKKQHRITEKFKKAQKRQEAIRSKQEKKEKKIQKEEEKYKKMLRKSGYNEKQVNQKMALQEEKMIRKIEQTRKALEMKDDEASEECKGRWIKLEKSFEKKHNELEQKMKERNEKQHENERSLSLKMEVLREKCARKKLEKKHKKLKKLIKKEEQHVIKEMKKWNEEQDKKLKEQNKETKMRLKERNKKQNKLKKYEKHALKRKTKYETSSLKDFDEKASKLELDDEFEPTILSNEQCADAEKKDFKTELKNLSGEECSDVKQEGDACTSLEAKNRKNYDSWKTKRKQIWLTARVSQKKMKNDLRVQNERMKSLVRNEVCENTSYNDLPQTRQNSKRHKSKEEYDTSSLEDLDENIAKLKSVNEMELTKLSVRERSYTEQENDGYTSLKTYLKKNNDNLKKPRKCSLRTKVVQKKKMQYRKRVESPVRIVPTCCSRHKTCTTLKYRYCRKVVTSVRRLDRFQSEAFVAHYCRTPQPPLARSDEVSINLVHSHAVIQTDAYILYS